jgi:AAA15 family ATPase/GTPase
MVGENNLKHSLKSKPNDGFASVLTISSISPSIHPLSWNKMLKTLGANALTKNINIFFLTSLR